MAVTLGAASVEVNQFTGVATYTQGLAGVFCGSCRFQVASYLRQALHTQELGRALTWSKKKPTHGTTSVFDFE